MHSKPEFPPPQLSSAHVAAFLETMRWASYVPFGLPKALGAPFTPIKENQMDREMENEMDTGVLYSMLGSRT